MKIELLKQLDEQEWRDSSEELWTIAITAARSHLYGMVYNEEDRKDVANQVLLELSQNGIINCQTEEDVNRWIWSRSKWRAISFRRKRRRENETIQHENEPNPNEEDRHIERFHRQVPPVGMPLDALVDELIVLARFNDGGFSRLEEAAFRLIIIQNMHQNEFAEKFHSNASSSSAELRTRNNSERPKTRVPTEGARESRPIL